MIPAGMFSNIGRGAMAGAGRFLRSSAGRTVAGGVVGGMYGAMSDNTSVLGGALAGAAGARYLGAGLKRARMFSGAGMGFGAHARGLGSAFARGIKNRARLDFRGARSLANQGLNRIGSTLKV